MQKVLLIALLIYADFSFANQIDRIDTIPTRTLDSVLVNSLIYKQIGLQDIQDTYIHSGKKSITISLKQSNSDLSSKIGRQVFSKVPGVFVYDMDGAGNQINIATRGLDPHRGWEFNNRKDGIITNSDLYGYPASHYSMPLESIEQIELVKGTGAIQYGAQFGGMLNYVSKKADSTKPFAFESIQTIGSYDLLSTYQAISGTIKKLKYYAYAYFKSRNGYRDIEQTKANSQKIALSYQINSKMSLDIEWSRTAYTYRIPGPLNDEMFRLQPQQSSRNRNFYRPDIHLPFVKFQWALNSNTQLQFTSSAILGTRSSVLFDRPAQIKDSINVLTGLYNHRQVDIDRFNSYTNELRLLHHFRLGKQMHSIASGIQYINNDLHRTQLGKGTTGADFNLGLVDPIWGRDLHFKTINHAFFSEQKWQLNQQLMVTSGIRIESGESNMFGAIQNYPSNQIPVRLQRQFALLASGFQYKIGKQITAYGGIAQSYRPMIFKDLIPGSIYESVDPNIKDAYGYNAEIGFKGNWKTLKWDITAFMLKMNNRFGTLAITDAMNQFITYRTNIGHSVSKGLELFIQADWPINTSTIVSLFTSTTFMDARYQNAIVKVGNINQSIHNNRVESAPELTSRNGVSLKRGKLSLSVLYSYVSETYADALNTVVPPLNSGAVGLVPSYGILDISAYLQISRAISLRMNGNNMTNHSYFTKRPLFYPGPGIWPSDGRNYSLTVGFNL